MGWARAGFLGGPGIQHFMSTSKPKILLLSCTCRTGNYNTVPGSLVIRPRGLPAIIPVHHMARPAHSAWPRFCEQKRAYYGDDFFERHTLQVLSSVQMIRTRVSTALNHDSCGEIYLTINCTACRVCVTTSNPAYIYRPELKKLLFFKLAVRPN